MCDRTEEKKKQHVHQGGKNNCHTCHIKTEPEKQTKMEDCIIRSCGTSKAGVAQMSYDSTVAENNQ